LLSLPKLPVCQRKNQHGFAKTDIPIFKQPGFATNYQIGPDVWFGANCSTMANVGEGCVIGAGQDVVKDIPDWSVAVGNPAISKSRKQVKNVLIICGSFPPQSLVGGLRPAMFAKYLLNYGWNPWVLTRNFTKEDFRYDEKMPIELPDSLKHQIIKVDYSLVDEQTYLETRTIIDKIRDFFYPEYSNPPGLYFAVKRKSTDIILNNRFDLIFATIPDQWQLTLGAHFAEKYKLPLIADFRDIKEQEEGLGRSFRTSLQVIRFAIRRFITTRNVKHIITVSEFHKRTLEKRLKRRCSIIYNGFDGASFKPMNLPKGKGPFRIIYIGRILDIWYRNPKILFIALDELITQGTISLSDVLIEFFGTERKKLDLLIKDLKNQEFIKFHDRISYADVPVKLNEAQMLLLLTNEGRNGILTTKLFEYAGVKKPILCIPGDQKEIDKLIHDYRLGYSISDVNTLKKKLVEWIDSYNVGSFPVHISSNVEFFSRENQTRVLSQIFNDVLEIQNS
jgi:glycosyltransferase involved in cell wall biosynthesis